MQYKIEFIKNIKANLQKISKSVIYDVIFHVMVTIHKTSKCNNHCEPYFIKFHVSCFEK